MRSLFFMAILIAFLISCKPDSKTDLARSSEKLAEFQPVSNTLVPHPTNTPTELPTKSLAPQETVVISIPIAGDASDRNAEISGMAWYEDWLILLPQYPRFSGGDGDGRIFALPREDILAFLNEDISGPLTPRAIIFDAPGLSQSIAGFEGYEAIVFDNDDVYLTIEASPVEGMTGYLVKGTMAQDLSELHIDTDQLTNINSTTGLPNKSDEALLLFDNRLVTIHEANGQNVNPNPVANLFDFDLEPAGTMPMASIEYRITDVTAPDENGRFWAINYFFPGEPELFTEQDPIERSYGQGVTHMGRDGVERLVELQIKDGTIEIADRPPLQLELLEGDLRNWEGITHLDGYGFLLVTDKFPETILGFVPYP